MPEQIDDKQHHVSRRYLRVRGYLQGLNREPHTPDQGPPAERLPVIDARAFLKSNGRLEGTRHCYDHEWRGPMRTRRTEACVRQEHSCSARPFSTRPWRAYRSI